MIQKISDPGKGFRGALNYVLAARKAPELIGGNMEGESARGLAAEFGHGRARNPAVGKPVFHASVTAAPTDALSEADWRNLAQEYINRLGYGEAQWIMVRHGDTANDHVHILANRVNAHGRRVQDFQERRRGEAILRELEREMGLTQVVPSRERRRGAPSRGELAAFERTGVVSVKARLQEHVDLAARGGPSLAEFADRLAAQGVGVRAHVASTARLSGLSFELDGVRCKGSDLGRGYSWGGLAAHTGISYEPARDLPRLRELGAVVLRENPAPPTVARNMATGQVEERSAAACTVPAPALTPQPPRSPAPPRSPTLSSVAPAAERPPRAVDRLEAVHETLRASIDQAAQGGPTLTELTRRLHGLGITMHPNLARTGRLAGLRFETEGLTLKGSELGRDYSWRALAARHGVHLDGEKQTATLPTGDQAPVEPLERSGQPIAGAPVYRSAAVLSARLAIGARVEALEERTTEPARIAAEARALLEGRAQGARSAVVQPEVLARSLRAAYGAPDAAERALSELMARKGRQVAADVLEHSPEQLGRLRGMGLGGFQSTARREALAGAASLGRELRRAARIEADLAAGAPAAEAVKLRGEAARAELHQIGAALRRLPHARALEADMVRAAGVLGPRITARIAPPAKVAGLLRRALRAALDRVLGRGQDLSLGR